MRTLNVKYISDKLLKEFLLYNNIVKENEVLIQIFTGVIDRKFIEGLISTIVAFLPNSKIIGSTTDGEIINNELMQKSTLISFSIFNKSHIKTYYAPHIDTTKNLVKNLYTQFENPDEIRAMISFVDGLHTNGEKYIKEFERYDDSLIIAGGLAGDNAKFETTFIFNEKGCYDNGGVVATLYGKDLIVNTVQSFGWKRLGKKLLVTKAKDNIVYTIDNIPTVDIYKKYLGDKISSELPSTGIEFPLIIHRNDIEIARAVIGLAEDGALVFAGNINEGDIVQFGYGDIDTIKSLIPETQKHITQKAVEAIFLYSCMARKRLMGDSVLTEIVPFSKLAPTCGFFTYGELFSKGKKHELLNETMTILTLSESTDSIIKNTSEIYPRIRESNKTINALTHLVGVATKELSELNETLEKRVVKEVEKNREKDKQLLHQSRLAQMGEMISMIAHQWRQPLSAIGSSAAGLKLKSQLKKTNSEMVSEVCDKILYSSKYLSSTIDDFRDFYKSDKELKETNFSEVLDGVLNIIKVSIENKNIKINLELQNRAKIYTHANELKQVVMNLLKNAEDVLLDNNIENPFINIKTYKKDGKNILEVSDNGGGIEDDKIKFIFDPYFSTKKFKDGTGLGLYMSKIIIEEHCGGRLISFNRDSGAVFQIELD